MSAITETEPGGEMVCILDFEARPRDADGKPTAGKRRRFSIGEHVRYLGHHFVATPEDNPIGYMARFEPVADGDGNTYGATQDYFVSLECWQALKDHFASNLIVTVRDATPHEASKRPAGTIYGYVKIPGKASAGRKALRPGGGRQQNPKNST